MGRTAVAPASASKKRPAAATPAAAAASPSSSSVPSLPASKATLQLFWDLAQEDPLDRASACQTLLQALVEEQQAYLSSGGDKKTLAEQAKVKSEDDMDDDEDEDEESTSKTPTLTRPSAWSPSLFYALKRLARGLAANRASARQGFALALTECVNTFNKEITTEQIVQVGSEQIKLNQASNRQETKDFHLGRIFFVLVLIRGQRVPELSASTLTAFVEELLGYGKAHLPIREVAYNTVAQMIRSLPYKSFASNSKLQRIILGEFANQSLENLTIEQVALSLHMKEYYEQHGKELPSSSSANEDQPKDALNGDKDAPLLVTSSVRKLFSSKYLPQLHTAMFSSMQHYAFQEQLHSTWGVLLSHLWRYYPFDKFAAFWKHNVEEALFGGSTHAQAQQVVAGGDATHPTKTTSYQKKLVGFQLVMHLLSLLPAQFSEITSHPDRASSLSLLRTTSPSQVLRLVFTSRHFMRTFVNQLSFKKNLLYTAAVAVKKAMMQFAKSNPTETLTILTCLEDPAHGGHVRFDARTNSDTVYQLLAGLNLEGVKTYVDKIINNFVEAVPVTPAPAAEGETNAAENKKGGKKGAKAAAAPAAPEVAPDQADALQQALDSTRQFCIDQLYLLACHKAIPSPPAAEQTNSWRHRILQFFLFYGFFDVSASTLKHAPFSHELSVPLSENTQTAIKDKLFHLLDDLLPRAPVSKRVAGEDKKKTAAPAKKEDKKKAGKKGGKKEEDEEMEDGEAEASAQALYHSLFSAGGSTLPWAMHLHADWSAWSNGTGKRKTGAVGPLLTPLSEEETAARQAALDAIESLRERYQQLHEKTASAGPTDEEKSTLAQNRSLQLLLQHLSLLLLKEDERSFVLPLLEDIQEGIKTLFEAPAPKKASRSRKSVAAAEADSDKPPFINVLLDLLLSLLIRPSHLFRDVARQTFGAFAPLVNQEALEDLMQVLRKKEKQGGEGEEDEEDEDSDNFPSDEDEEDEEEEEEKKPKKGVNKKKKLSADEEAAANAAKFAHLAANSGSDSESDDDEQLIDVEGLNKVFAESDQEDEEALALAAGAVDSYDAHLGNIVRLRNERKTAQKEFAQQSLHFKLRVCDLLEVYIRAQSSSPLLLHLYLPMLLAVDASRSHKEGQQLKQKLVTLYKKLCSCKDLSLSSSPELPAQVRELMGWLMARAVKSVHRDSLQLTNLGLMSLARLLMHGDIKTQIEEVEKALQPQTAATPSKRKSKAAAAPAESGVAFVFNLYRTELVKYISVKHSLLNTKFFTDVLQRFPGMAWAFAPTLAELAQARLPEEHTVDGVNPSHPYAANAFLRNDCFLLLHTIFANRNLIKDQSVVFSRLSANMSSMIEAIRSAIVVATLPKSALEKAEEQEDEKMKEESDNESGEESEDDKKEEAEDEEAKEGETAEEKARRMREKKRADKKEREKLRLRAKKKRRVQRQREAARLAALAAGGEPSSEKAEQQALKSTIARLKTVFKFANQAALVFAAPSPATTPSPIATPALLSALSALPSHLATPLKSVLHTFLTSARVDRNKVKLQIDESVANKDKKQVKVEAPTKKNKKQAGDKSKKRPADSTAAESNKKSKKQKA